MLIALTVGENRTSVWRKYSQLHNTRNKRWGLIRSYSKQFTKLPSDITTFGKWKGMMGLFFYQLHIRSVLYPYFRSAPLAKWKVIFAKTWPYPKPYLKTPSAKLDFGNVLNYHLSHTLIIDKLADNTKIIASNLLVFRVRVGFIERWDDVVTHDVVLMTKAPAPNRVSKF